MGLVDRGTPEVSARQWVQFLTPDPTGTKWVYGAGVWPGGSVPVQWPRVNDLTGTPVQLAMSETLAHEYPNNLYAYGTAHGQLRAANGRIFFLLFGNNIAMYDPTTQTVSKIVGPVVETPPVDPNASTTFYSASFDTDGNLWLFTQESQHRPSMLVFVDTTTLAAAVVSYFGNNANAFTTYGFRGAPDVSTATKFVYEVYGEDPWQLWATNVTPGPNYGQSTKLLGDIPSTGNISFRNIAGQGWVADVDSDLGQPDNVRTSYWCLDGALYAYTTGQPPPAGAPATRNVTPLTGPLVNPPQIDFSGGSTIVLWKPFGAGTGVDWTEVRYTIDYADPVAIESLCASDDGVYGIGQNYNGPFNHHNVAATTEWFGPWASGIAQSVLVKDGGLIYAIGYPNTAIFEVDLAQPWHIGTNPLSRGAFAVNGTQNAGTKYPVAAMRAPGAGASGRIFACGTRERNGSGSGIGWYDKTTHTFGGKYSSLDGSTGPASMKTCLPTGLVDNPSLGYVAMASKLISPPGDALLYIFDYSLATVGTPTVKSGLANLGQIFPTSTPHVVCGVCQGSGSKLALYAFDLQTQTLLTYTELPIVGTIGVMTSHPVNGAVWVMVGNALVHVDVDTLQATRLFDLTAQAPIVAMAFAADQKTPFLAGSNIPAGIGGAHLYSLTFDRPARFRDGRKGYTP